MKLKVFIGVALFLFMLTEVSANNMAIKDDFYVKQISKNGIEKYIFSDVTWSKQGTNLVFNADVNETLYNLIFAFYNTPNTANCLALKNYFADIVNLGNCNNPQINQLLNFVTQYVEQGIAIEYNGNVIGYIDLELQTANFVIPQVANFKKIKIGQFSILNEYQDTKTVSYSDEWVSINSTLFLWQNNLWNNTVDSVFISSLDNRYKFGATHQTQTGQTNQYRYLLTASENITYLGEGKYAILKNHSELECLSDPFGSCESPVYDFIDVCDDNCYFGFQNSKTLEVIFNETHNNTLGYTLIDPSVEFSGSDVEAIDSSALNNDTFVVAWCDETFDDITFAAYNANGTVIRSPTDADSNIANCNDNDYEVSVSSFNSTSFILGWHDANDTDISFAVYNLSGANITPITIVDSTIGVLSSVSLSAFNQTTFVIAWADTNNSGSQNISYAIYDYKAVNLIPQTVVETINNVSNSRGVSVSTINGTSFGLSWFNVSGSNVIYGVYSVRGNSLPPRSIAAGLGNGFVSDISTINSTVLALSWYNSTGQKLTFRTFLTNGTPLSDATDFDKTVFRASHPSIEAVNDTTMAVLWFDTSNTDIGLASYTFNGTFYSNRTVDVSATALGSFPVAIAALEVGSRNQICSNKFVTAFQITDTSAEWRTYHHNLEFWNGDCLEITPLIPILISSSNVNIDELASTPLESNVAAFAWCDETNDDVSFSVYYTNGTQILAETDVDADVGSCDNEGSTVSITAFNSTSFAIGYIDDTDDDVSFGIFDRGGNNLSAIIDVTGDGGGVGSGVSVSAMNSTQFAIAWHSASTPMPIVYAIYSAKGEELLPTTLLKVTLASSPAISASAINSTDVIIAYFDDIGDTFSYVKADFLGSLVTEIDIEAGDPSPAKHDIKTSVINKSLVGFSWSLEPDASELRYAIYTINGTRMFIGSLTAEIGSYEDTAIATTSNNSVAIGWTDSVTLSGGDSYNLNTFNSAGGSTSWVNFLGYELNNFALSIASENFATGIQICKDNMVYSYAQQLVLPSGAYFSPRTKTGAAWNGECSNCEYTGGNWDIVCSDNCTIRNSVTINTGNNITMRGAGSVRLLNNTRVINWRYRFAEAQCYYRADGVAGFY